MEKPWTDPRDGKEWRVHFTWTGPVARPRGVKEVLTPTVGPSVLVAPHTQRHEVAEGVRPACRFMVSVPASLPATCEFHGTAPTRRMMRAYPHRTFTTLPGALEKCLPGSFRYSHRNASYAGGGMKVTPNRRTNRRSHPERAYSGAFPRFHLMLQPTLGVWSGAGSSPASTASAATRRSSPVGSIPLPGRLASN